MKYYGFINENLQREVESNKEGHIIFNSQRESDMGRLKELLKDKDRITIEFSEDWYSTQAMLYRIKDKKDQLIGARQYVSAKILQALEEKYPQMKEYEGSKNLEIFKQGDSEKYKSKKDSLYTLKDIEEMLDVEDIHIDRIHFILRDMDAPLLCNALTILLSDDTPFNVTIYSSTIPFRALYDPDSIENKWLTEVYSYTTFNKGENGEASHRLSSIQKR